MKPIKNYNDVKAAGEAQERLPNGGYLLKILNAELKEYDWGEVLIISFDIASGDYAGYYKTNYASQNQEDKKWKGNYRITVPDENSQYFEMQTAYFKRDIEAVEESNKGFVWDWDESKLKGKAVGGIFHDIEYDVNGSRGFYTGCHHFVPAEVIKSGKFKIPKARMLKKKASTPEELFGDEVAGIEAAGKIELPF